MSNFKNFSKRATKDSETAFQAQVNEHTEVNPSTKPKPDAISNPVTDQKDKGIQPDHNTSKPT